ncbi:MAG TPA: four helix bundle protein [Elusimicrobiota bacterium]|nr:four helix bundle protein [Elusimicrobiota bacterium]
MVTQSDGEFDFERLDVYQRAVSFTNDLFRFCNNLPFKVQSSLGDQLRRASLSVCNNIAEGSDKASSKEKIVFYNYALSSMRECVPCMTVAFDQNLLSGEKLNEFREKCLIICRMLKRLIQSVERRGK